jgi:hypothetical protein
VAEVDDDNRIVDGPGFDLSDDTWDWDGALRLAVRLTAPFMREAHAATVRVQHADGRIAVHVDRQWSSILVPINLQIFGALQALSHGRPAAARCQECGNVFLRSDQRRRSFCNGTERNRYWQREHRKAAQT